MGIATNQNLTALVNRCYFVIVISAVFFIPFSRAQWLLISFVYHHPSCEECWEESTETTEVNQTSKLESFMYFFVRFRIPFPDSGFRIPDSGFRLIFHTPQKNADSRKTFINAFHGQWTFRFTDSLVSGHLYLPALFSIPLFTSQSNSVFTHSHILSEKCRCLGEDQKKRRDKGVLLLPWRACFRSRYSFFLSLFLRYVLKLY